MKSILIKDTTKEEREQIVKASLDCGGGCENCSSCWLGGGSPWDIYQDYLDGKREIKEINAEYMERYRQLAPRQQDKWAPALYKIYLNLNMGKQFDEIDKLLKK